MTDQPAATGEVDAPETAASTTAAAPLHHNTVENEDHEQKKEIESEESNQVPFDYANIKRNWEVRCMLSTD